MSQKYDIDQMFNELKLEETPEPLVVNESIEIDDQVKELHKVCSQYLKSFESGGAHQYNSSTGPYDDQIMSFDKIDSLLGSV